MERGSFRALRLPQGNGNGHEIRSIFAGTEDRPAPRDARLGEARAPPPGAAVSAAKQSSAFSPASTPLTWTRSSTSRPPSGRLSLGRPVMVQRTPLPGAPAKVMRRLPSVIGTASPRALNCCHSPGTATSSMRGAVSKRQAIIAVPRPDRPMMPASNTVRTPPMRPIRYASLDSGLAKSRNECLPSRSRRTMPDPVRIASSTTTKPIAAVIVSN